MEIITRNRAESLEDYIAQNLDSDGGLSVEIDGVEVRISQQWECPLDCSDYYPTFLNLLKDYEFGTRELESKDGEILEIIDICDSLEEVEQWLEANGYFYKRVNGYAHSGLSLSLDGEGYYCKWDSGCAGYLVMRKSELREARGVKRITKRVIESELRLYSGLIYELNAWLEGSIFECEIDGDYIETSFSVCELAERIEAEFVRIQQKEMA